MRIATVPVALAVLVLPGDSPAHSTTYRHHETLHQLGTVDRALQSFFHDVGRLPSTEEGLKALVDRPSSVSTWNGPYIRKDELVDSWGGDLKYAYPAVQGRLAFDLYSFGGNRIDDEGASDDLSNWAYFDWKQYPTRDFWNDALVWILVFDLPAFLVVCAVVFVFRLLAGRGPTPKGSLTDRSR